MSCPWANVKSPEPVNFLDIVSEEVAKDLQAKEEESYKKLFELGTSEWSDVTDALPEASCDSDAMIARMLQLQFDKEHDENLKRTEDKYNGTSKVSISFDNYRRTPQNFDFESDSDEEEEVVDVADRKDWDRFDTWKREFASIPACGYKIQNDGSVITKHDVVMSGRKNACKMLSFPPNFQTGDGEGFDMKLSNTVFNSLKMYSQNVECRRHKVRDKKEDRATAEFGLDEFTTLLMYKLINQGIIENVNGIISLGKEAVILHADCNTAYAEQILPAECVFKVFKTTLSEFKQRDQYIKDDYRFKDRIGKQTARKTVQLWAEKEMHNLNRLKRAGIPCPDVILLKKHILAMSFIGVDHRPAPKLKDAIMDSVDYVNAYEQVTNMMKTLYTEANLIHADLSEYNILWHNKQCYIIDVSQSVEPVHVNAFYFLRRDCTNISTFFSKKNISNVESPKELFKAITGEDFDDDDKAQAKPKQDKIKPHTINETDTISLCDFENLWQRTKETKSPYDDDDDDGEIVESPLA